MSHKPLFKKAAIFTDLHLGLKGNSVTHNEDCLAFTEWFISESQKAGCDVCLFLGDFFNNRNSINLLTMDYGLRVLRLLSGAFNRVIMIPGNHDCYYKEKRSVHSIAWAQHVPNIEILNEWHTEGNCIFVPWMVGDDHKKITKARAKYVFGHFELPNFLMNQMVRMPEVGELHAEDFSKIGQVFSGHFHKRQVQKNITYLGNAFPHNYADAWDDDRGLAILEWDQPIQFLTFPDAPKYRTYQLSDLIANPAKLEANSYVKVVLDIDISYEEATFIKESFIKDYNLRELSLISGRADDFAGDSTGLEGNFESVDTIVTNNITSIESECFSPELLLEIYRGLS